MKFDFTNPFTGQPITTTEELWRFVDENHDKFEPVSADDLARLRQKIKDQKTNNHNSTPSN